VELARLLDRAEVCRLLSVSVLDAQLPAGFISDSHGPASPWSLEYYQFLFDVDTKTVCLLSRFPAPNC
jgi:hypothetical protein